jgi:WhiB family redox-sensing transcriptional regulator
MPRAPLPRDPREVIAEEQEYLYLSDPRDLQGRWWVAAACHDAEPDVFFPVSDRDSWSRTAALEFCAVCPVRAQCLTVALTDRSLIGIWGGTDEAERARLRRRQYADAV